jgi:DHA2 family multidrug resistance protein
MSEAAPAPNRSAITASLILAMLMNTLDSTIANVALPHIQGSLSAATDEVVWVLTSYIVAAAMTTPLSGWMSNRFGIKRVLMITLAGFTVSSVMCGLSTSLPELVMFRLAQGAFGSFTLPIGQTVMFNVYPPSRHAQAMSIWGMGAIMGPLLGPLAGGYITDAVSWRWCFFINLPLGGLALLGVWAFMPSERHAQPRRFDFLGFATLIVAVGALQLMLDRGAGQDWFGSHEIWIEMLVALIAFWMFLAHTSTTRTPFIDLGVVRDPNLSGSAAFIFVTQGVIFGSLALMPQLTQGLMGYPVFLSGMVNAPRGAGMLIAMGLTPRLMRHIDPRAIVLAGICGTGFTLMQMARFDLSMGMPPLLTATFWQGLSQGLMFAPLTTLAFVTLRPEQRAEGAAIFNLTRSMGSSIGISVMQALAVFNTQAMHAAMAARVAPSDPVFRWAIGRAFSPDSLTGAQALDAEITRQATMVAYVDDFRLMFLLSLLCAPLVFILRTRKTPQDLDLKDAAAAD